MSELRDSAGLPCAALELRPLTPEYFAIRVLWREGASGVPDASAWHAALNEVTATARLRGATRLEVRVVTMQEGDEAGLAPRRAAQQREGLRSAGFVPGEERVEYVLPIEAALTALAASVRELRLAWRSVPGLPGPALERAAALMHLTSEGDPDHDPGDDALAMLLTRAQDASFLQAPDCVQVGTLEGEDAVIVLPGVRPASGVGGLFYLGVHPRFRGRGLGAEALLRGLGALHAMGAHTYHDGTAARNVGARRLFDRLAASPSRAMEQWKREL